MAQAKLYSKEYAIRHTLPKSEHKLFQDLTGNIHGKLIVIGYAGKSISNGNSLWWCECLNDGNIIKTDAYKLKSGRTSSCGCLQKQYMRDSKTTHGMSKNPLYAVWYEMIQRCHNIDNINYNKHGARGIIVCDRWRDKESGLENFIKDVEPNYVVGLHIDRIDNDGNYELNNVRWVSAQQNQFNSSSRTGTSKYKGVCKSKGNKKWSAQIYYNRKKIHLGMFCNEIDAAIAYNKKAIELFGEHANLNKIEEVK